MPRVVIFDEIGDADVLHIVDEPLTEPASGEVRVRIEAIGINRADQMMRTGFYLRAAQLPRARLGCEGTGIIDAIGPGVDNVAVGDAVLITAVPDMDIRGTYAEYTNVPATSVIPRPAGVDPTTAAALWVVYSTAYGALIEKARMQPGDHLLITAASSAVGLAAIQVANQIGAIPIAVTRSAAKKEELLSAGAAAVITTDTEDVVKATQRYTNGVGVDIILDSIMGPGLLDLAKAAKFSGTLVTVGWLDTRPAPFPMNWPLTMFSYISFEHTTDPAVVHRTAAFLTAGLRIGVIRPKVDKVFNLNDIANAHRYLEQGQQVGKVVVTV